MATTTKESWRTLVVQRTQTEKAKDGQYSAYNALRGTLSKTQFENALGALAVSIVSLVFRSTGVAATVSSILYTVLNDFTPSRKQVHANGVFNGYAMYKEMSDYMDKYGYRALQVSAYNMTYTNPKGTFSLLFGNNTGTQLNKSFKVTGIQNKSGQWIYA